ncbi:cytochrome c oxidase accessory protein CcoG [bacterium]|nr:cytochrome c oxidase accessory protein CcoG [bacterium]
MTDGKRTELPVMSFEKPPELSSTIGEQGKRKWVYPDLTKGKFTTQRNILTTVLILFYFLAPWISVKGNPLLLFDIAGRQYSIFGNMFLATDLYLFALFLLLSLIALFWFSAMFGRLWCGWACPQTIYMEGVYRRIERWIEGNPRQQRALAEGPRDEMYWTKKVFKHGVFWMISTALALSFTAYFIGPKASYEMFWTFGAAHPTAMTFAVATTALTYWNFAWFREQFCHFLCPYARIQSVFLDEHSLIIGYDPVRGEPRGAKRKGDPEAKGDCVDCFRCVQVCPAGIDIRNGLQLECVQCTACIDACDVVMEKTGKPHGLIRYDSAAGIEHKKHKFVRARVIIYMAVFALLLGLFVLRLAGKETVEFAIVRQPGTPYLVQEDGVVRNMLHLHMTNADAQEHTVRVQIDSPIEAELLVLGEPFTLKPGERAMAEAFVMVQKEKIATSSTPMEFKLMDGDLVVGTAAVKFLGPVGRRK